MATKRSVSQASYDKANTRQLRMKLNLKTDSDILTHLDAQPNMQGYIKSLIRADIAAHGGAPIIEEESE